MCVAVSHERFHHGLAFGSGGIKSHKLENQKVDGSFSFWFLKGASLGFFAIQVNGSNGPDHVNSDESTPA